ncbi:MAG: HD domain-containing protein [Candidatus Eremiobacteraeota bacterium]|nr:HD domain-containing protein [Candidatus Eremiobacteraeota bacterium]
MANSRLDGVYRGFVESDERRTPDALRLESDVQITQARMERDLSGLERDLTFYLDEGASDIGKIIEEMEREGLSPGGTEAESVEPAATLNDKDEITTLVGEKTRSAVEHLGAIVDEKAWKACRKVHDRFEKSAERLGRQSERQPAAKNLLQQKSGGSPLEKAEASIRQRGTSARSLLISQDEKMASQIMAQVPFQKTAGRERRGENSREKRQTPSQGGDQVPKTAQAAPLKREGQGEGLTRTATAAKENGGSGSKESRQPETPCREFHPAPVPIKHPAPGTVKEASQRAERSFAAPPFQAKGTPVPVKKAPEALGAHAAISPKGVSAKNGVPARKPGLTFAPPAPAEKQEPLRPKPVAPLPPESLPRPGGQNDAAFIKMPMQSLPGVTRASQAIQNPRESNRQVLQNPHTAGESKESRFRLQKRPFESAGAAMNGLPETLSRTPLIPPGDALKQRPADSPSAQAREPFQATASQATGTLPFQGRNSITAGERGTAEVQAITPKIPGAAVPSREAPPLDRLRKTETPRIDARKEAFQAIIREPLKVTMNPGEARHPVKPMPGSEPLRMRGDLPGAPNIGGAEKTAAKAVKSLSQAAVSELPPPRPGMTGIPVKNALDVPSPGREKAPPHPGDIETRPAAPALRAQRGLEEKAALSGTRAPGKPSPAPVPSREKPLVEKKASAREKEQAPLSIGRRSTASIKAISSISRILLFQSPMVAAFPAAVTEEHLARFKAVAEKFRTPVFIDRSTAGSVQKVTREEKNTGNERESGNSGGEGREEESEARGLTVRAIKSVPAEKEPAVLQVPVLPDQGTPEEAGEKALVETAIDNRTELELKNEQVSQASRNAATCIESVIKKSAGEEWTGDEMAAKLIYLLMKASSTFTFEHSSRVIGLSVALAQEIGITDEDQLKTIEDGARFHDIGQVGLELDSAPPRVKDRLSWYIGILDLKNCSFLHDIGKVKIPDSILYKPGRLTDEEFQVLKQHPVIGEAILKPIASLAHVLPVARHHHEKWDGKGYPDGLAGEETPLAARIVCITDAYDAMVSDRPYRKGMGVEEAVAELRKCGGTHFDPRLVEAFLRVVEKKPHLVQGGKLDEGPR